MNNLAVKPFVLSGIEWTIDHEFHYGIENARYIEALVNDAKYLPIKDGDIEFASNTWDLRPYYTMKKTDNMVFNFKSVPQCYLNLAKFFVLLSLLNSDKKVSTIHRRLQDIKPFLLYLYDNGITSVQSVMNSTIGTYMTSKQDLSVQTRKMIYISFEDFFTFIKANYSYKLHFDFSVFDEREHLQKIAKKAEENNKTPDIPSDYYNKLISLLIQSMRNASLDYEDRAISCIYLILSQTGLRISEVLSLETDSLSSIKLKNLEANAYFLTYKVFKSIGKEQEFVETEIFANELTKEAFDTLVSLRNGRDNGIENNFIYLPNSKVIPATDTFARKHFHSFLYKHAEFARSETSPYPELNVVNYKGKPIIAPTSKQFRVHVCTELYYRNVPLLYIKKYMSHLSDEMMGYYVRPKSKKQEDAEYSNKLLKSLVTNEANLLGNDAKQIQANIANFINEGHYNVEQDIDAIIESLNGKFVIRAKQGGVCIKTSIRECSKDARTNEMFCAYNICPSLFHLYYMADTSYEDFKLSQKTFKANKSNGFKLQASKELKKLQVLCRRRLLPELEDLKDKIKLKGVEGILTNYPNLGEIIKNYDNIMEEINQWMNMKY
ncbi:tyrosine-type recombinase/integrase [Bacillaceae bacterium CLA-AA-H227]|uniref:Tyrosine-type recombinase/integrase n=1 Tax=Robertmurraya yapensis (ex Hitch et al 2024) TaxID=3133160 RepID=A0ACC6SFV6_9BACI